MRRRRRLRAAIGALAIASALSASAAPPLRGEGRCRDDAPHGAYELRTAAGQLRAIGAFNRGRRTGSFIFWNGAGARVAHLPYEDDALNGTAALWYGSPLRQGATPRKRETAFAAGRRSGTERSWYADGRPRTELEYRDGVLVSAAGWDARGRPLPEADATALARRDEAADDAEYRALEDEVRRHPPDCRAASGGRG